MSEHEKKRVGLFTPPVEKAGWQPLSNVLNLLSSVSDTISIISANIEISTLKKANVSHYKIFSYTTGQNSIFRILNFFILQMKISLYIINFNKYVDVWLFFGGEVYIMPLILARLLKKPVYCLLGSSARQMLFYDTHHFFIKHFAQTGYFFANKIILYSTRLISEWNLEPYHNKIFIANHNFNDFNTLTITTPLSDRQPLIGYIGRISAEKGVQYFAQALPTIFKDCNELRALIGGSGQLKESIETLLEAEKISDRVDLPGWISYDDIPSYLNRVRLLVLPSYTEGLPNIIIEAMACGTPILATPVGAIPDIIRDGETGFIMEDNSPECIAKNVIRALSCPDLERIADEGRRLIEVNYQKEFIIYKWKKLFKEI
jgi:glycosyltransferase involved in cell wall biosynthesis